MVALRSLRWCSVFAASSSGIEAPSLPNTSPACPETALLMDLCTREREGIPRAPLSASSIVNYVNLKPDSLRETKGEEKKAPKSVPATGRCFLMPGSRWLFLAKQMADPSKNGVFRRLSQWRYLGYFPGTFALWKHLNPLGQSCILSTIIIGKNVLPPRE